MCTDSTYAAACAAVESGTAEAGTKDNIVKSQLTEHDVRVSCCGNMIIGFLSSYQRVCHLSVM